MNKEFSEKNYSVSTFWDKRAGRIMLSINLNRTGFSLSIHLYCSQSDYLKAKSGRMLTSEQKKLRDKIYSCVLKAEELLSRLNEPTKESFIKFYKSDLNLSSGSKVDCFALLQAKFVELESEERFGSAKSYLCTIQSFKSFRKTLYLEDVTESFVKGYKDFMVKRKRSATTIGMYLRNLRAIYNQAVSDGFGSSSG